MIYNDGEHISCCLEMSMSSTDCKGAYEHFFGDGNNLHLDYDNYMVKYIFQNS